MADPSRSCRPNADRRRYGLRGQGGVTARARCGGGERRRLHRNACGDRPPERKGTPALNGRLPDDEAASALARPQGGHGARQAGRPVGVHRDAAVRLGREAGEHARAAHDELAAPPDDEAPA